MGMPSFYGQPYTQHHLVHHQTTYYAAPPAPFEPYNGQFARYPMVPSPILAQNVQPYYYQHPYYFDGIDIPPCSHLQQMRVGRNSKL